MRSGRKSAAQTPAPKKDRIYGSKTNPKGSASSEKSAKSIVLSDKTMKSLQEKLKEFKEKHPAKKNITLNDLKAVYRRGLGAYSSTHRPTITGGVPNTRNAWAMARVNKFLLKAGGTKVKAAYVQDDDLMKYEEGGELENYSVAIKENGLQEPFEWNSSNSEETIYVPENEIYAFLYNAPNTQDKIDNDALIFSNNRGLGNFWEDLKTQKGSESLVAILKGRLSEDKTKLYILTMTTKNEFRKKGLMSKLIREVRSKYNIDKENVIFIGLTDMGQKMYKKKRYAEGGLIAPNGNPSNLTTEQYKLVRTPEFKAWFGDWENSPETASKVVDENGEPLVCFHGTDRKFTKFNKSLIGSASGEENKLNGFYFTNDYDTAKFYAEYYDENQNYVLTCFLNIKNPIIKEKANLSELFDLIEIAFQNTNDGVILKSVKDSGRVSDQIVVFEPNQIKLADGTNTTFDDNPDIRFADGGRFNDQELLKKYKAGESIGFTGIAHLKAKGLIARADGTKRKSDKYKEMGGNVDEEIKLPELNMSYGALKETLNYQGYDIEPMKQELQIGKVAKGMSVQQIAQHHNTTVDEIQKQLDKGIQVEMEHTDNQDIARAIALDHVYESPVYYDKLETIEKEFKDGGVVVGKRHSEYDENGSGEKFLVESTGQVVELEGGEGVLCQESMSSDKKFSFDGKSMTGREIASYLNHKYGGVEFAKGGEVDKKIEKIIADKHVCGCKHQYYHGGEVPIAVVRNLKGGEAVVTVKSMESKDQYNFNGKPMTPRQIFSQINMASGGKKFEDGGVINLQSIKDDARLEFDIQLAKMMYFVTTLNQMI
jgi:hypothetical protein